MKHLDLFAGIGGFSLGLQMAGGFETVAACELPENQAVFRKNFPDVFMYGDIKELTYERLQADGFTDISILTGGFPCQPFSHAGQRRGTEDDRHLWPEMLRVISEVRPTWVIGENVAGIVSMELSTLSSKVESKTLDRHPECDYFNYVLSREANMLLNGICEDLEQIGYEVQPLVIPACGVDAKHRRDRVWIIAHSRHTEQTQEGSEIRQKRREHVGSKPGGIRRELPGDRNVPNTGHTEPQGRDKAQADNQGCSTEGIPQGSESAPPYSYDANTNKQGLEGSATRGQIQGRQTTTGHGGQGSASPGRTWSVEPDVGRVADGIPGRVDRLRGLGNAVVPQVVEQIGRAIMQPTLTLGEIK